MMDAGQGAHLDEAAERVDGGLHGVALHVAVNLPAVNLLHGLGQDEAEDGRARLLRRPLPQKRRPGQEVGWGEEGVNVRERHCVWH